MLMVEAMDRLYNVSGKNAEKLAKSAKKLAKSAKKLAKQGGKWAVVGVIF